MSSIEPGVEDATRRTYLAAERTWLAWWRTGMTAVAAGVGIGRLLPELSGSSSWPYAAIGAGYTLVGVAMVVHGETRHRRVGASLRDGSYVDLDNGALRAFTAAGVVLGLLTVALIIASA